MNIYICKYCNNPSKKENTNSLRNHERLCSKNPDRNPSWLEKNKDKLPPPWNKGKTLETNPELVDKLSAGGNKIAERIKAGEKLGFLRDNFWTPEKRKEKSIWRIQLHKDNPESHPNRKLAGNRNRMTYPEKVAFDFLLRNNIKFDHQKQISKYFVDFLINNVVIEIDGARWHNKEKDAIRDSIIESLGYIVHRIDSKDRIEDRIKDILGLG